MKDPNEPESETDFVSYCGDVAGHTMKFPKSKLNAAKAIRLKCLDCSAGSSDEVDKCPVTDCPLYDFRFGKTFTRHLSDEQRARLAELARERFASKS